MTDARLHQLRRLVRSGELPADLVDELRAVARSLARRRLLPPSFAPYGQWDDEAADEVFAGWYTERLLAHGQLQALLDRARAAGGFRRLAERSLRHHLINAQDRSQASNLYRRLVSMLEDDEQFRLLRRAARPQEQWYALAVPAAETTVWTGDDRMLIAHAWALGDFVVVRYKAAANKLSPMLDAGDLARFAAGLLRRVDAALTPALIMRALSARFDLAEPQLAPLDENSSSTLSVAAAQEDVFLRDVAATVVAELTPRQRRILQLSGEEKVADIAETLNCSVGTVINEQRRIGMLVARLTESSDERDRLLNVVADLLYVDGDD